MKPRAILLATLLAVGLPATLGAQPARELYARALGQERAVRDAGRPASARQIRGAVAAYERVVHRYPRSGYADNALWQAGNLALLAYERFGQAADRRAGLRLLSLLKSGYPSSSLVARVPATLAQFDTVRSAASARAVDSRPSPEARKPAVRSERESSAGPAPERDLVTIRGITRTAIDNGIRVSIEMDRELMFHQEALEHPRRLFFDIKGARAAPDLIDATIEFADDAVREIRLGRHPNDVTRVVIDSEGTDSHSVFTLYNPYRLIVDFRRTAAPAPPALAAAVPVSTTGSSAPDVKAAAAADPPGAPPAPPPARPLIASDLPAPEVPSANSNGKFSLARQLGLGVARVVIDAGHGGHDPGAKANGLSEAEVTLDVARRLKKLLEKHAGIEVVMTRETDVYVPLEERTAIANREGADLFLSIHANASRNTKAHGVETYFLNFATNPEAEAVAARENSASGKTMHNLPSILRAIALNNKIDESRDFAATVQKAMVGRLAQKNKNLRDLGVKQAPFVVLIGAGMPSVLAEISFVTHRQEGQLLKTGVYRQTIAEALQDAVLRYQRSLKAKSAIASRE